MLTLPYSQFQFDAGQVNDIRRFRQARRAIPLSGYDTIEIGPQYLYENFRDLLDAQLTAPFALANFSIPSLDPPIAWSAHNASFAFHLNAWNPISLFLMGHSQFGAPEYFAKAWAFARSWIEQFQKQAFTIGACPSRLEKKQGPSAWYDMAVGHRVYRIAYLLDVIARDDGFADSEVELLYEAMIFHLRMLERDDFFKANHNHGFFQAIGELAALRRFADEPIARERLPASIERVTETIDRQFHPGGIHREHSPGYHYMILFTLIGAHKAGLLKGIDLEDRLHRREEAFSWMIDPSGQIATIGDTDARSFAGLHPARGTFEHPWLRWQLSVGSEGTPPPSGVRADVDSGWVFARGEAGIEDWWYFAQIAAFHSRAHKQADDLSFVWSDRGVPILIDPARYAFAGNRHPERRLKRIGFTYNDPSRIYVEQTRAHNAVEIDGLAQDRTREPYGSALRGARMENVLVISECQLQFGTTLQHWRTIVLKPDHFLLAVDWLEDSRGRRHDFRQFFQFAPEWQAAAENGNLIMRREELALTVLALARGQAGFASARGQKEPDRLGWYSDKAYSLLPCTSLSCEKLKSPSAIFATLLTFGANVKVGHGSASPSPSDGRFAWMESETSYAVELNRQPDGSSVGVSFTQRDT
jgi:hypothetical protein